MSADGHFIRNLVTALIALAVLFAPAVASAAAAHSAVPDHQMQMMEAGHCKSTPSNGHDQADGHNCCISAFWGLTLAPAASWAEIAPAALPLVYLVSVLHRPYLGEIATPPPRQPLDFTI